MMATAEEKQYVIDNIDRAISEGWIKAYYQPIIRTANGQVCHEEALCRWEDPTKGLLSPAVFIPTLEEINVIYKLDLYMVELVINKMKEQTCKGVYVVPISVNFSRSDFYACDIVEEIRKRVDEAEIARDKLVVEITESIVADNVDYMLKEIERFKALGFSVWMDDFGSGYSSPIILQKVPFDLIKLDMLFVRQLFDNEKAGIILTEIVRMAMALGLDTVAEGVETKEQADFLKDIGCTMLQGYYFCKPITTAELFERYEKGIQIGFENPDESEYYAELGKVNLYNLPSSLDSAQRGHDYFDTWPMVMLECLERKISVVRANMTFKNYIRDNFPKMSGVKEFDVADYNDKSGSYSLRAVINCAKNGRKVILDDRTVDGKILQLLVWRIAVNPSNDVAAVMVVILSSTEISSGYTAELKKSVTALLTNMPAMTFSKDVITRKYLACNQAFADYAHKETPEGVVGLTDFEIFDAETAYHFIEDDIKALSMDKPYMFYEDVPDAVGNMRQFQTTKLRFTDDSGRECLLGLCQDVTDAMRIKREYVQKLEQVQNQAHIDSLTGVKNKNAYHEKEEIINRRIAENRQNEFAITVLDVNNLKEINDTQGHNAGDRCICEACEIICNIFKRSPVYRVGGDEFVVLSVDEDYECIDELIDIVSKYNEDALSNGGIVIACGMARYMDDDESVSTVFNHADQKMYENKAELKVRQEKSKSQS